MLAVASVVCFVRLFVPGGWSQACVTSSFAAERRQRTQQAQEGERPMMIARQPTAIRYEQSEEEKQRVSEQRRGEQRAKATDGTRRGVNSRPHKAAARAVEACVKAQLCELV